MSIQDTLRKNMFEAKKDGDVSKANILSMVMSSIKNEEINKGKELTDDEQIQIIRKETKKLVESYELFTASGRKDLADNEKYQLEVLNTYLPQLMSEEDIRTKVKEIIDNAPKKDMGVVMGLVMKELKGKADGNAVNKIVKELLS
ncbi:MAG TPA: GatB/YqeY domain-containing protein [Candidatus Dojkabacteria bacterium]|nr:GatB/YqeY domain-containing protein [Candidatus Dojkabacteria bacterium]